MGPSPLGAASAYAAAYALATPEVAPQTIAVNPNARQRPTFVKALCFSPGAALADAHAIVISPRMDAG